MNLVKSQDKDINQQKSFAFLMKIITIKKQKENLSNPFHLQLQQKRIKYPTEQNTLHQNLLTKK